MRNIRVMFMGTPDFAKEILQHLINLDYNIVATVSQPDRPVGRKRKMTMTPVKKLSTDANIDCIQPEKIKNAKEEILAYKPDVIITCAYGQIIPKSILDFPKYGAFNIHASLLPKLRGGAPIHKAIMYNESETGITIMEMSEGMDEGDMILKRKIDITKSHTTTTLSNDLITIAKKAIEDVLPHIIAEDYEAVSQDNNLATYAYNISKEEEFISFEKDYNSVDSHIRSLIDKPVGYGIIDDLKIKIHGVKRTSITDKSDNGSVVGLVEDGLGVVIDNRVLVLTKLQPAGKKVMYAKDFMNGQGQALIGKKFR